MSSGLDAGGRARRLPGRREGARARGSVTLRRRRDAACVALLLVLAGGGSAAASGLAPLLPDGVASASREVRESWCERAKAWAMTLATVRDEGLPREKAEETVATSAATASATPVIRSIASFAYRHRELEWDVVTVLVSTVSVERHLEGAVITEPQVAAIVTAFGPARRATVSARNGTSA